MSLINDEIAADHTGSQDLPPDRLSACDSPAPQPKPLKVIEPPGRWVTLDLPELWRYRDLRLGLHQAAG
jgi:hypothetical protein